MLNACTAFQGLLWFPVLMIELWSLKFGISCGHVNFLFAVKEVYLDCSSFMRCQEKLPSCTHTSGSHRILLMDLTQRFSEVIQSNEFLILFMVFSTQVYASKLCQHRGSQLMSCNIPNSHSPWKEMYNFTWDWHQSVVQSNVWELREPPFFLEPVWSCLISLAHSLASVSRRQPCKMHVQPALLQSSVAGAFVMLGNGTKKMRRKLMWVVYATHIHRHDNDHTTIAVWWFTELTEISMSPKLTWNIKSVDNASPQIRVSQSSSLSTRVSFDFSVKKTGKSSQVAFAVFGSLPENTNGQAGQEKEVYQCKKKKHQSFNKLHQIFH